MLVQISVRNFKTFREKATLSLVASGYDKQTREGDNVVFLPAPHNLRLLKSAVVYGANASGKTKLVEALTFMKRLVLESDDEGKRARLTPEPFLLDAASETRSSEFEVVFIRENIRYRYGFELLGMNILSEWLYQKPKDTEIEVFYRSEEGLESHSKLPDFRIGRKVGKEGMVKEHTLWLTAATKWNDVLSNRVTEWFRKVHILSGIKEGNYIGYTVSQLAKEGAMRSAIIELAQAVSIGLEEVVVNNISLEDLPIAVSDEVRAKIAKKLDEDEKNKLVEDVAKYPRFDESGNRIGTREFRVQAHESSGTRKYLALSGPILDVLRKGSILVVDELDARLHPNLVCRLVGLFNSTKHNPKGAQLIFNTHDTNLLSSGLFRRDQIWFTEKDRYGASTLYALTDYSPRKGEDLEANYILGKYGAIPYLGDFDRLQKLPNGDEHGN